MKKEEINPMAHIPTTVHRIIPFFFIVVKFLVHILFLGVKCHYDIDIAKIRFFPDLPNFFCVFMHNCRTTGIFSRHIC